LAYVHKDVHGGARWCLVHGSLEGPGTFAVCELQRALQRRLPYVLEVRPGAPDSLKAERHLALLGTREANPLIAGLIVDGKLPAPEGPGGYSLAVMDSPWADGKKVIAVAGADAPGVLHGAVDFCSRILAAKTTPDDPREMRAAREAGRRTVVVAESGRVAPTTYTSPSVASTTAPPATSDHSFMPSGRLASSYCTVSTPSCWSNR